MIKLLARIQNQEPLYTWVSLEALRNSQPVDDELARQELDHNPRPFEGTIAAALDWFTQNGYLDLPSRSTKESQ